MMKRIQIASIGKRIVAALIDLALISGLTCLFYYCVFYKIAASIHHFDEIQENVNQEFINSGLYAKNEKGEIVSYTILHPDASVDEIHDVVKNFYVDYLNKNTEHDEKTYTPYWFGVYVLHLPDSRALYENLPTYEEDQRLYKWSNYQAAQYVVKDDAKAEDLQDFWRLSFGTATVALTNSPKIASQANVVTWANVRAIIYASIVGTIIPFLIVPVCLKNGKSIGKLCMGLVVLTDEGYEYKRWKHIIRYIAFYLIEAFGGVVTIGLTLLFSSCLVLFSKKRRALHDFIAFSVVADEKQSLFFKDEDEELMYKEKQESLLQKKEA